MERQPGQARGIADCSGAAAIEAGEGQLVCRHLASRIEVVENLRHVRRQIGDAKTRRGKSIHGAVDRGSRRSGESELGARRLQAGHDVAHRGALSCMEPAPQLVLNLWIDAQLPSITTWTPRCGVGESCSCSIEGRTELIDRHFGRYYQSLGAGASAISSRSAAGSAGRDAVESTSSSGSRPPRGRRQVASGGAPVRRRSPGSPAASRPGRPARRP